VGRRMDTTFGMADKRSLQVNAQGTGSRQAGASFRRALDRVGQAIKRGECRLNRSGDRGRQVRCNTVNRQQRFEGGQRSRICLHHVVSSAAVDVQVKQSWH
jgi:hypothetical protein